MTQQPSDAPFDSAQGDLEEIVERFERAWHAPEPPRIEAYLPSGGAICQRVLLELVHADLEFRIKAGEPVRVEAYVARYPELGSDREVLSELVQAEFDLRRRARPAPSIEDYRRRFPQLDFHPRTAECASRPGSEQLTLPPTRGQLTEPVSQSTCSRWLPREEIDGPAQAASAEPLPHVAGYQLFSVLGRGCMGIVFKARDSRLNRLVALKMVRAGEFAGRHQRERFAREAELIARLHHPHIVEIFEVGESGGQPYLALEFVEGGSLEQHLNGVPQAGRKSAELVATLAEAVHAAHRAGVVHRDLKPANVLLTREGTPKVTDFGLAKPLEPDSSQTHSGTVVGTPSYMAPEQAQGRARDTGCTTDVYALGAILYEMLTGRPPFRAETLLETLEQVRSQEPVPPSRLQPKVPRDLETICLKCLQKEQERRYPTAQALADDLHRFLKGEPIHARPTPLWERTAKWARRRPTAAGCILASLVAGVSLLAGALLLAQYQHQRADLAERELRDRAAADGRRREVAELILRGQQEMVAGRPREAQMCLTKALAKVDNPTDPESLEALQLRGLIHGELGEYEAAEADFHSALTCLQPGTAACYAVHVNRGLSRFRRGALIEAEADLREAIRLRPDEVMAYANLAQVYQQQERWDDALAQLDRAIERQPEMADLFRTRARVHSRQGDLAAALRDLDEAIRLKSSAGSQALAEDLTEKARIFLRMRNTTAALESIAQALALQPDHAYVHQLRGEVLLEQGRAAEALASFEVCLEKGLRTQPVYFGRGRARAERNDFVGAIDDFSRALALQPDSRTYARRGWLYLFCKAPEIAVGDFRQALRLDPRNGDAYSGRSLAQLRLGQFQGAISDAERAVQMRPDDMRALYNAACIYAQAAERPALRADSLITEEVPDADFCRGRSLELLGKAMGLVPPTGRQAFRVELLDADPDLKPIRRTRGFTALVENWPGTEK